MQFHLQHIAPEISLKGSLNSHLKVEKGMEDDNWEGFVATPKSTHIVSTHILWPCQTTSEAEKCFVVCQKEKEMYLVFFSKVCTQVEE